MLLPGAAIRRKEKALFNFEVLRAAWEHEDSRWTAAEEQSTRDLDLKLGYGNQTTVASSKH